MADADGPAPGAGQGRYADLGLRLASAAALAVLGFGAMWAGGGWFLALVAGVAALMIWELAGLAAAPAPAALPGLAAAVSGALAVVAARLADPALVLPLAFLPAILGLALLPRGRRVFAAVGTLLVLAAAGLVHLREDAGFVWTLWLVLVVIATDALGYFAGRALGGPRLWTRVSPKKTWAGTIAGWAGALAVGAGFMAATGAGPGLLGLSLAAAMAAQLGDIAESAVKRRAGVKDASRLIPGHGGLFDRFDGLFGAVLFVLIAERVVRFPPLAAPAGG